MKKYFAYIRVSTAKQGERGVSLQEQKSAILRFAERHTITITQWFEERVTAAKRGRTSFDEMMQLLRKGKADGIVVHKIDRSARNLRDWADLGELIDAGIEVHFVNESLDLNSRGGRLSADIQAVVAADYIRNLREETRKGFYGRLKQGLLPLPAPVGYLDRGRGKAKEIDPERGPLIARAFDLYATEQFNLITLSEELFRLGLRNRAGGKVTYSGLSIILNNPFYFGMIRIKKTGEVFQGTHTPLISKSRFDEVQDILSGKRHRKKGVHDFIFRRLLTCALCQRRMIGELQKGHVYYRCHTKTCPTKCIREEKVDEKVQSALRRLNFTNQEKEYLNSKLNEGLKDVVGMHKQRQQRIQCKIELAQKRLMRLTDAFVDGLVEKELFEERKRSLFFERASLEEELRNLNEHPSEPLEQIREHIELAHNAWLSYKTGLTDQKRELVRTMTSNRFVQEKDIVIDFGIPFSIIANRAVCSNGDPLRDIHRTNRMECDLLFENLLQEMEAFKPSGW